MYHHLQVQCLSAQITSYIHESKITDICSRQKKAYQAFMYKTFKTSQVDWRYSSMRFTITFGTVIWPAHFFASFFSFFLTSHFAFPISFFHCLCLESHNLGFALFAFNQIMTTNLASASFFLKKERLYQKLPSRSKHCLFSPSVSVSLITDRLCCLVILW